MTTKKQMRERVAAKRKKFDAETQRMGLEAQQRSETSRQQRLAQDEEAMLMRRKKPSIKRELPDNLAISYANTQAIDLPKVEDRAAVILSDGELDSIARMNASLA